MNKTKLSAVEKRLLRTMIVFLLIQIVIIIVFIRMLSISHPINIQDTRETEIIVEEIYYIGHSKDNWLVVIDDSKKYLFESNSAFNEYSVRELSDHISVGDKLSVKYYERFNIFGKVNIVVDARTDNEIYRTIEDYNRGKEGVPVFVMILFSVIELVFVGIVLLYVWMSYDTYKGLYRKIKKHKERKNCAKKKTGDGSLS